MDQVTLAAAFVAGLLSFVSPCVLPLVPGYLSFVSGFSLDDLRASEGRGARRWQVFAASLAFVLGFSTVFVALGASASAIGQFLLTRLEVFGRIAGLIVILFGLHTMGVLPIGWLYREKRVQPQRKPAGLVGAFVVGIAFAFGWTPCIGPILAGILAVAGAQETIQEGVKLLAVYSLGLGIPFLATALAVDRFFAAVARVRRFYRTIEVTAGLLLVTIGALIFTNRLTLIARLLTPYLPTY